VSEFNEDYDRDWTINVTKKILKFKEENISQMHHNSIKNTGYSTIPSPVVNEHYGFIAEYDFSDGT
jgi:hypothetical protein